MPHIIRLYFVLIYPIKIVETFHHCRNLRELREELYFQTVYGVHDFLAAPRTQRLLARSVVAAALK